MRIQKVTAGQLLPDHFIDRPGHVSQHLSARTFPVCDLKERDRLPTGVVIRTCADEHTTPDASSFLIP